MCVMVANGRIATSELRQVDGWAWLAPGAAAAWLLFAFACQMRWGIRPTITRPDGAYRSYARQLWWWVNRFVKKVVVAYPGTSNHGLGMAVDVYNWARFPRAEFVALARSHGFIFDTASENWHMRYTGAPHYNDAGVKATASLVTRKKDNMTLFHIPAGIAGGPAKGSGNHLFILVGPDGFYWEFLSTGKKGSTAGNLAAQCGGSSAAVTSAQRDQIKAMCAEIRKQSAA